jgi:DNA-binding transcriptional ArsR family regulator
MRNEVEISRAFHALGDPTRIAIFMRLSRGPVSMSELARPFDMSLQAIGQHIQLLEKCGLVQTEKIGRTRSCSIKPEGLQRLEKWIAERKSLWQKRLDRLRTVLDEKD